jgi:hypothetical protein
MQSAPFELSQSQKIQVTLLYLYASFDYLKELRLKLQALMVTVDPTLDLSKMRRRNSLITASQRGAREMSENWRNDPCSILMHFERSVEGQMTERASDSFSITIANDCERSLREVSLAWMTPDEQDNFDNQFQAISWHAGQLDDTLSRHQRAGRWDDFSLMLAASECKPDIDQADSLRLRPDILGVSGTTPARTGVYLPLDDPYGTPQFCWTGNPQGVLLDCNTFNELGLEALASIGRDDLWINKSRMLEFARRHANDPRLTQDPFFDDSISDEDLAPSLVARNAFTTRPCRWMYVEQIHGALKN